MPPAQVEELKKFIASSRFVKDLEEAEKILRRTVEAKNFEEFKKLIDEKIKKP